MCEKSILNESSPPNVFRCDAANVLGAAAEPKFFDERIRTVANVDVSGTSDGPWNSAGVGIENSDAEAESVGGTAALNDVANASPLSAGSFDVREARVANSAALRGRYEEPELGAGRGFFGASVNFSGLGASEVIGELNSDPSLFNCPERPEERYSVSPEMLVR
jgi:hypothetical protein